MQTILIQTYGCSANQNNSEILKGILTQAGYQIVNNEKIADIIILNTCIVKGKTENKIKRRIQDLKKSRKLLIVSGCMPETNAKQIKQLNEKAILLGTHHFKDILNLLRDCKENKLNWQKQNLYLSNANEEKLLLPKLPENRLISITQISEGCLGSCSFCKARLAKGRLFSYLEEKILKSIENDLTSGAKEIWLTSQDNAAYGLDKGKQELPDLLNKILALNHRFKLRLGMMNPNNLYPILNQILEIFKNKKLYKFLHIPIQSASDKLLKDMNRNYKIKIAEEIITKFRKEFPDITIATDIIVGYPTETEQDYKLNLDFINKFKPDVLNLSKFSKHKNTEAGKLKELDIKTINKRTSEIMQSHRQTANENKKKFLNKEIQVFINKKIAGNLFEARDENYHIILIKSDENILGRTLKVKIREIGVHHMIGEINSL